MISSRSPRTLTTVLALAATLLASACTAAEESTDPADGVPAQLRIAYQAVPNGDLVVKHEGWLEEGAAEHPYHRVE